MTEPVIKEFEIIQKLVWIISEINFCTFIEYDFDDRSLIAREATDNGRSFLLVVGFRRSSNYPKGKIEALLVEPVLDEDLRKRILMFFNAYEAPIFFFE